jgi:hypothetical protein
MNRFMKAFAIVTPLLSAALLASNSADACGGCFVPPSTTTVVSGHRMALSLSPKQTVLWDQIQYQGNPEDFSWVLPIKPGARVEQASDEWFETLEASTLTTVQAPPLNCNGGGTFGCGNSGFGSAQAVGAEDSGGDGHDGVTVVHQETVGPYESVTLSSKDAGALTGWLESHGYDIPDDIQPIIAAYVNDGFDFIALRLTPGNGVNLMSPVRVITQGASPVLPLRMVSAGTGAFTSIILYVLGEGRWTTQNFPEAEVPLSQLSWDGNTNESNYAELRAQTLASTGGHTWIAPYAQPDALFGYSDDGLATGGIGFAYVQQILHDNGDNYEESDACYNKVGSAIANDGVVVDPCNADSMECGTVGDGQIDARGFECGELTDLATALVGLHPRDVWVTRLEANLPRTALLQDLTLEAAASQVAADNYHVAPNASNYECPSAPPGGGFPRAAGKSNPSSNGPAVILVGLGAVAALLAARRRRTLVRA